MGSNLSGVWELALVFGAVLAFAIYEIWSLRRLRRRREREERDRHRPPRA